jgi:hypothetical protein
MVQVWENQKPEGSLSLPGMQPAIHSGRKEGGTDRKTCLSHMRQTNACIHEKQQILPFSLCRLSGVQDLSQTDEGGKSMTYYYHNVPGRLRVKIPMLRNSASKALCVEQLIAHHRGIEQIKVNAITGSVIVFYDPDLVQGEQIIRLLVENGYFDNSKAISHDEHVKQAVAKAGAKLGRAAFGWVIGKTLEANGLSLLAALI